MTKPSTGKPKDWNDREGQPRADADKRTLHEASESYSASKDRPPLSERPAAREPAAGKPSSGPKKATTNQHTTKQKGSSR